jgi:putative hydrolase
MHAFNHDVASKLREIAALLNTQHANPFRCNAYLHAADTLDNMPQNIAELMQAEGIQGLIALPAICHASRI